MVKVEVNMVDSVCFLTVMKSLFILPQKYSNKAYVYKVGVPFQ